MVWTKKVGRKQDWTKKVGRKQVGRKQVGRKLGLPYYIYVSYIRYGGIDIYVLYFETCFSVNSSF